MKILPSKSIETLANRIRGVPIDGTLRFISHPQYPLLLEIVKMFIDCDYFAEDKFQIYLTEDYSTICKVRRPDYEGFLERRKEKDDGTGAVKKDS